MRLAPRPLSDRVDVPRPPLTTWSAEIAGVTCGEPAATVVVCSIEATSEMPRTAAVSVSTTSIGAALVNASCLMREPVTTICSTSGPSAVSSASCAIDGNAG